MPARLTSLLLLAGLVLPASAHSADTPATAVVTVESMAESHARRIVLRGRTEADRRVDVRAEVTGLVASAAVRRGAVVQAGDVLCRIDEGDRPADLAEARAALLQAEADNAAAERLAARGFTAQTEALARTAALEAARGRLMRAELALERLTIRAPFAGVLEDDSAALGSLLQPGGLCATVISVDPIVLLGYLAEREVDHVAVGMPAEARLVSGRIVEGTVRFIARSAETQTRTFRVEIALPNPDLSIREGVSAEIAIRTAGVMAHRLPQSALTLGDDGQIGVRIVENDRAAFSPVRIIDDSADGMWVSGLPDRAEVIVVGQEFVGDGSAVRAVRRIEGARP